MLNIYMGTADIETDRKIAYQAAADKAGLTMSEWVREILDTAVNFNAKEEPKGDPK